MAYMYENVVTKLTILYGNLNLIKNTKIKGQVFIFQNCLRHEKQNKSVGTIG